MHCATLAHAAPILCLVRHLGIPLGVTCLGLGLFRLTQGHTSAGAYFVVLGVGALLTWYATTRSAWVQRWEHSDAGIRVEILAPGAAAGIGATGVAVWMLANGHPIGGAVLLVGGLIFIGCCLYLLWSWRGTGIKSPEAR